MAQLIRAIGLICCLGAVILGTFYFLGRPLFGTVYTPFLLLGVGILFLLRAKLTRRS